MTDPELPPEVNLFTPWGSWIVGESTQVWFPVIGYTDQWSPVAWHPDRRRA